MNKSRLITGGMALIAALGMLSSCSSSKSSATGSIVPVSEINGEWNVLKVGESTVIPQTGEEVPYLGFNTENSQVYGYAGCNRLTGSFDISEEPGSLSLENVGSTRMMCADMNIEDLILSSLGEVAGFRKTADDNFNLVNKKDEPVILLGKRSPSLAGVTLEGEWTIINLNNSPTENKAGFPFTMTFDPSAGTFSCKTDCNTIGGTFKATDGKVTFSDLLGTMMACENMNIEMEMTSALQTASTYNELSDGNIAFFDNNNQLLFILKK